MFIQKSVVGFGEICCRDFLLSQLFVPKLPQKFAQQYVCFLCLNAAITPLPTWDLLYISFCFMYMALSPFSP